MKYRKQALRKQILSREIANLVILLKGQDTDESWALSDLVHDLNDMKRDFITNTIIFLAKLDFRRKFLEWYMDKKGDALDEDYIQDLKDGIRAATKKYESIIHYFMGYNTTVIRQLMKAKNRVNTQVLFRKKHEEEMKNKFKTLDKEYSQHIRMKKQLTKQWSIEQVSSVETLQSENLNINVVADKQGKRGGITIKNPQQLLKKLLKKEMPMFQMYSKLDVNLFKHMIIKCAKTPDE